MVDPATRPKLGAVSVPEEVGVIAALDLYMSAEGVYVEASASLADFRTISTSNSTNT